MNILAVTIVALLLTSANALQAACPDLTGDHYCPGSCLPMNISQSADGDGTTTYTFSWRKRDIIVAFDGGESVIYGEKQTVTHIADGIEREFGKKQKTVSCGEDNTLRVHIIDDEYETHVTHSLSADGQWKREGTSKNLETGEVQNFYKTFCRPSRPSW